VHQAINANKPQFYCILESRHLGQIYVNELIRLLIRLKLSKRWFDLCHVWGVWKERNRRVFHNTTSLPLVAVELVREETAQRVYTTIRIRMRRARDSVEV
jgi:hypothetical protein